MIKIKISMKKHKNILIYLIGIRINNKKLKINLNIIDSHKFKNQ